MRLRCNALKITIGGMPVTPASFISTLRKESMQPSNYDIIKNMTAQELQNLPEISNMVLWTGENDPTSIIDEQGVAWFLGWLNGNLYKRKAR